MLYLAIDLHGKQLTVNLRDEDGEAMIRRQVSTRGEEPRQFLEEVWRLAGDDGYVAILEVCGFHEWLTELLPQCGCREVVLIQAEQQSRRKTDRRDANQLGELLWINRARLLAGRKVQGVRRVVPPTPHERDDRRLTQARRNNGAERTRVINGSKHILRRLNIGQHCPTKGIQTKAARKWLKTVQLPEFDRLEMNQLLARWELLEKQGERLDEQIAERALSDSQATLLRSIPGVGFFTSLGLSSRIGDIGRFLTPRSLGNYWGLTPSCKNSGETTKRIGSITKAGSSLARFLLGQLVLQILKKDATIRKWYRGIKRRRGSKIARVAVMRRLTVIIWHMLKHQQPYDLAAAARPQPSPRRSAKPDVKPAPAESAVESKTDELKQNAQADKVEPRRNAKAGKVEPKSVAGKVELKQNAKPVQAAPKPVQAAPKPVQAAPKPVQAAPKPVQATPKPVQAAQSSKVKPKATVQAPSKVAAKSKSPGLALGALPPNPRDLSLGAPLEGSAGRRAAENRQKAPASPRIKTSSRLKTGRRPKPPALRPEPESGAQVASRHPGAPGPPG